MRTAPGSSGAFLGPTARNWFGSLRLTAGGHPNSRRRSAYDDCHASSPVWPGAVRASEDPSLGSIGEMAWASERPRPTNGYLAGRAGIQREDIFVGGGRAGRPQPADVLSQPGGMDELQAFLSLLAASTGAWAPESAIWRSGVVISTGTPRSRHWRHPRPSHTYRRGG